MLSLFQKKSDLRRDRTSTEKNYRKAIKIIDGFLASSLAQLKQVEEDQRAEQHRYPATNEEIIHNTWLHDWSLYLRLFSAYYSMGAGREILVPHYQSALLAAKNVGHPDPYHYHVFLEMVSVAVLFSQKEEDLELLEAIGDDAYPEDFLTQFLLHPGNKKLPTIDSMVVSKPFGGCAEAIGLAGHSDEAAMKRLSKYMNNQWKKSYVFQAYDEFKSDYYVGNWCYECAAVVARLGLDDSQWAEKDYYPYALRKGLL